MKQSRLPPPSASLSAEQGQNSIGTSKPLTNLVANENRQELSCELAQADHDADGAQALRGQSVGLDQPRRCTNTRTQKHTQMQSISSQRELASLACAHAKTRSRAKVGEDSGLAEVHRQERKDNGACVAVLEHSPNAGPHTTRLWGCADCPVG